MFESEASGTSLTIRLLGPMEVLVNGSPLPHLRSRKALWLLALLALRNGRSVDREWLAAALWPDVPPERAAANLRVILSELRHALGSEGNRLKSPGRHTLSVDLGGAYVDVCMFDAAIEGNDKNEASLKRAVALYSGPLLEDCAEEWVGQERNQREQSCLLALQMLADAAMAAGDYAAAANYCQRSMGTDPWGEAALRTLMEALAKSGDRNAALHAYREFAEFLRNDPSAGPDAETSALYARLRAEAQQRSHVPPEAAANGPGAEAPRVVSGYLPHPLTGLIGRGDQRLEIAARLRASRLLTLTGPGGIGKTRLALAVSAEVVHDGAAYPDGVWLASLEAITEPGLVVDRIAAIFELREEVGRPPLERLSIFLHTKRLLLVLDNCEHLLDTCAHVASHLLRDCARVRILATSREALGIMGEAVFPVPCLAAPDPKQLVAGSATLLQELADYESVQLFVQRAQERQRGFVLTQSNALAIAQVCFQLDGIPLAIEFAAARVNSMTVRQITGHLNDHLSLLTVGNRSAPPRQRTLRATLDWSYGLLTEPERLALGRLSAFAGGWTLEAAVAIVGDRPVMDNEPTPCRRTVIAQTDVLDLLTSLVQKSLVSFEGRDTLGFGRYRFLEPVRQYAAESISAVEKYEAGAKHREWCMALAEEAEPHLRGADQEIWLLRLETEHDNLRKALTLIGMGIPGAMMNLRLAGALRRFWSIRGYYSEGRSHLEQALGSAEELPPTIERAKALYGAGALAFWMGDFDAARERVENSLTIRQEAGDSLGTAESLNKLGNISFAEGDFASAKSSYTASLEMRRLLKDKPGIAQSLTNLGDLAADQGELAAAQTLFAEGLSIRREIGDRVGVGRSLHSLTVNANNRGDLTEARALAEEGLSTLRDLGDRGGINLALRKLGHILFDQGYLALARVVLEESLNLARELGLQRAVVLSLISLGEVIRDLGDFEFARSLHEEGLHLARELGERFADAGSRVCLGRDYHGVGDLVLARSLCEEGVAVMREVSYARGVAWSLRFLGDVVYCQGDVTGARSAYQESLSIALEMGDKFGRAHSLNRMGQIAHAVGDDEHARWQYLEALCLFKEIGAELGGCDSMGGLATVMPATVEARKAACLLGAVCALRESALAIPLPYIRECQGKWAKEARNAMGQETFIAAWDEGRSLTWKQAIEYALEG